MLLRARVVLRIDVVDTGRGIPEEERDLVFEEFYRGTGDGEDAGGPGLGLGLSIVQRMACALGHPVQLHSRVGRGTRMSVEIPLATMAPDAPAHPSPVATTLTGARVLVIENDASTAEALERLLRGWDAEVESHRALTGVAESLRNGMKRPDVMILDYHLSDGACGLDVADHLREARGWVTPVIVATADYSEEVGRRVVEAQAELMLKPVKPAQLRALLAYLLA